MPRGKGLYDEEKDATPRRLADGEGDTGTDEEETPDVAKTDQEPTA